MRMSWVQVYTAPYGFSRRKARACSCAGLGTLVIFDSKLQWEDNADYVYSRGLGVIFVGFECRQCHFSSWPKWATKNAPQRRKKGRWRKKTQQCLWPKKPLQIPRFIRTIAGSRPLNQRRCLEGAPIKQILKECFIHNTSRRCFVSTSGAIDFLQVISLQRLLHYTVHFVVQLCEASGYLKSY